MKDKNTTIHDLLTIITKFRDERGWKKFHSPRNLATSIVLESSELLELFQWDLKSLSASNVKKDKERMEEIKKEMSDVIIYCLLLADVLGVDVASSILSKMESNKIKYSTKYFNNKLQDSKHYKEIKLIYRAKKKNI